jgi:hypothetical protein
MIYFYAVLAVTKKVVLLGGKKLSFLAFYSHLHFLQKILETLDFPTPWAGI